MMQGEANCEVRLNSVAVHGPECPFRSVDTQGTKLEAIGEK